MGSKSKCNNNSYNRNNVVSVLLALLLTCDLITETYQQVQLKNNNNNNVNVNDFRDDDFQYNQGDVHHIVKRKSKGKLFGFGRKPKTPKQNSNPYPKQPAYSPSQSRTPSNAYPKQPAFNPNYKPSNPAGPPPPYPGLNTNNRPGYPQQTNIGGGSNFGQQSHYPQQPNVQYPQQPGYNYGSGFNKPGTFGGNYGGNNFGGGGFGQNRNPFGNQYGSGFGGGGYGRKSKGLGIGRNIGSAGFGALAGTALGAYGGYKLGRMVGRLGTRGHYGYYNDHGRYMRCEPPRNIKIDPETNISYIPLDENYDKRCSYFDQAPPSYIEPSMLRSAAFVLQHNINYSMIMALISISLIIQIFNKRLFLAP